MLRVAWSTLIHVPVILVGETPVFSGLAMPSRCASWSRIWAGARYSSLALIGDIGNSFPCGRPPTYSRSMREGSRASWCQARAALVPLENGRSFRRGVLNREAGCDSVEAAVTTEGRNRCAALAHLH